MLLSGSIGSNTKIFCAAMLRASPSARGRQNKVHSLHCRFDARPIRRCCALNERFVLCDHQLQNALRAGLREDGDDCTPNSPRVRCSEKPSEVDSTLLHHIHHLCGQARHQSQGEGNQRSASSSALHGAGRPVRKEQLPEINSRPLFVNGNVKSMAKKFAQREAQRCNFENRAYIHLS